MKFVLASHNKGKLAEMQAVLADLGIEVVMPADLGIYVDVEETGETFAENAALKANAIMAVSYTHLAVYKRQPTATAAAAAYRARSTASWPAWRRSTGRWPGCRSSWTSCCARLRS